MLDLSLRRGVSDDVIGGLLRISPAEVARRRDAALRRLAREHGLDAERELVGLGAALADLPLHHWHPDVARPRRSEGVRADRRRRWAITAAVVGTGVVAGALIGVTIAPGGPDSDPDSAAPEAAAVAGRAIPLEALGASREGRGTAALVGSGEGARLVLRVRGLPPLEEPYAIWLYDSVDRAVLLERVVGGAFTVVESLPADPSRYRFIDVSREPLDGNSNHSGASVLRVPLGRLLEARS